MKNAAICIAIVDDEPSVRTALERLLRLADYEVAAFGSGDDFLASLAVRVPGCVILDVHMPGASGFAVQAQLRAANFAIPAVFVTASDDPTLQQNVVDAGGTGLLRKPFSAVELLEAVGAALRRRPGGML